MEVRAATVPFKQVLPGTESVNQIHLVLLMKIYIHHHISAVNNESNEQSIQSKSINSSMFPNSHFKVTIYLLVTVYNVNKNSSLSVFIDFTAFNTEKEYGESINHVAHIEKLVSILYTYFSPHLNCLLAIFYILLNLKQSRPYKTFLKIQQIKG